jgi:hypothetical protein
MPWSGGTYTKGNNATGGWTGDASLGIGIEAGRHDTQDNDFATGINQCLNKDGTNSATGDLNLGGFRPTNIAAGTAAAPAVCVNNDTNTGVFGPAADTWAVATNGAERLRVSDTGNIGIGTTAPATLLDIQTATENSVGLTRFTADASPFRINFIKSRGATIGTNTIVQNNDSLGVITFFGANGTGYTNGAEIRAEVDGVPGATNDMPTRIRFATTSDGSGALTERMRIESNGNMAVGTTSAGTARVYVRSSGTAATTYAQWWENSSSVGLGYVRSDGLFNTGLAPQSPYNATTASAANVVVDINGSLLRSTSSARYKTDIQPYTHGLAEVLVLAPKFYKGINDGNKQFAGLIAEDVHDAGLNEFVVYNDSGEPDALAYSNMVALAFKAIQELNTKVENLESRVAALEGA